MIRQAPDAPAYGTAEWLALPHGPAKIAAVVRAAECWARDGDTLLERLRAEVEHAAWLHKREEDANYVNRSAEWRRDWIPTLPGFRADPLMRRFLEKDWAAWVDGLGRELLAEGALRAALVHGDLSEIEEAAARVDALDAGADPHCMNPGAAA